MIPHGVGHRLGEMAEDIKPIVASGSFRTPCRALEMRCSRCWCAAVVQPRWRNNAGAEAGKASGRAASGVARHVFLLFKLAMEPWDGTAALGHD